MVTATGRFGPVGTRTVGQMFMFSTATASFVTGTFADTILPRRWKLCSRNKRQPSANSAVSIVRVFAVAIWRFNDVFQVTNQLAKAFEGTVVALLQFFKKQVIMFCGLKHTMTLNIYVQVPD